MFSVRNAVTKGAKPNPVHSLRFSCPEGACLVLSTVWLLNRSESADKGIPRSLRCIDIRRFNNLLINCSISI